LLLVSVLSVLSVPKVGEINRKIKIEDRSVAQVGAREHVSEVSPRYP